MYKDLTIEELEAKIDEVAEKLEANPTDRSAYEELARMLFEHSDRMNRLVY